MIEGSRLSPITEWAANIDKKLPPGSGRPCKTKNYLNTETEGIATIAMQCYRTSSSSSSSPKLKVSVHSWLSTAASKPSLPKLLEPLLIL